MMARQGRCFLKYADAGILGRVVLAGVESVDSLLWLNSLRIRRRFACR